VACGYRAPAYRTVRLALRRYLIITGRSEIIKDDGIVMMIEV